jgi:nucleoside-diphosphate-sugar epimerase
MPHSVLITGAFGNIGSRTVRHLLARGHRVVAVDLQTRKAAAPAASLGGASEVVWGNICDPSLWPQVLSGIDTVVHLAAIIPPVTDRNPDLAIAVNQTATLELVKEMEASPTAKRLIFASSMGVAGHEQHRRTPPLTADGEPQPTDLYGRTKVECERRIRASSLRWSILRLAVCPPTDVSFKDVNNFAIMFDSSASGRVELVHSDDAGLAFANAVDCDEAIGRILLIGGGESCRSHVLELYNRVLSTMGLKPLNPEALRPGPPYFYGDWLDTAESQKLLAFQRHSLDDILSEMKARAGFKRRLLGVVAPLVNVILERRSPHRALGFRRREG